MKHTFLILSLLVRIFALTLIACQQNDALTELVNPSTSKDTTNSHDSHLTVYKTPSCGCCTKWLEHLAESGVPTTDKNLSSLAQVKSDLGIAPRYRSCHTGVSEDGFVFEGHVPAKFIKQFLNNPPKEAFGLSVPAMPIGSPGMEVDDGNGGSKFMPYKVLQLNKDGSTEVFSNVPSYSHQF